MLPPAPGLANRASPTLCCGKGGRSAPAQWFLNLLRFIQGDAPESSPTDPVAGVREAWDAEMLLAAVADFA